MKPQTIGHLAALFTILNWGTTFIATKVLLRAFTPVEILVFRFMLGLLVLYIFYPKLLRIRDWKQELTFVAAGLTGGCLYYLLENIALQYTTAANVGIIVAAAPMFTAIFSWKAGVEKKPTKQFFVGFLVAICGICLISFHSLSEVSLDWRGDLLTLVAAAIWGAYSLLVKRIDSFGYPILQTTRRTFFYGLLFMIPAATFMDFQWRLQAILDPQYLWLFLYLGIGACAMCFVTWGIAVVRLGPVKTSVYLYISPVITMVCSVLILKESVSGPSLVGAVLTLSGLIISQWDALRGRKALK